MKLVSLKVPPDKSISQRAVMLASVSKGTTHIKNLLMGSDVLHTINAFRNMGVNIKAEARPRLFCRGGASAFGSAFGDIVVRGVGMRGLKKPSRPLYLGNSGTTMRILPGILAGQEFEAVLAGDKSLSSRPMKRIAEPLMRMGVCVRAQGRKGTKTQGHQGGYTRDKEIYPPLAIKGSGNALRAINYKSKIASAQVKTCILFAGLFAHGETRITEPVKSRDHTEKMLNMFGCKLKIIKGPSGNRVSVRGPVNLLSPGTINIPGDISSAAFFIVAGCILPGIKVVVKDVGLNPTRTGIIDILKRMGGNIKDTRTQGHKDTRTEPSGDITVRSSELKGIILTPEEVVRAIDEMPILMVAACFASGITIIRGIEELRVKETDRIKSMVTNLRKIGADVKVTRSPRQTTGGQAGHKDTKTQRHKEINREEIVIKGGKSLHGATVSSFGDHRTAMSMLIAGLAVNNKIRVTDLDCINKSFPGFQTLLKEFDKAVTF